MKTTVSVIALKSFSFNGQQYEAGEAVAMTPIDAVVLAKKHLITLTKRRAKQVRPEPPPPPPPVDEPKRKRTYKRRDLQAEQPTAEIAETDAYESYRASHLTPQD